MKFPIKLDTVTSGCSIAYIKGSQVIIFKTIFLSLMIDFLFNSILLHNVAFHLGLHCLPLRGFWPTKG